MTHIPCWVSSTELGLDSGRALVRAEGKEGHFSGRNHMLHVRRHRHQKLCDMFEGTGVFGWLLQGGPGVTVAFRIGGSVTTSPGRSWSLAIIQSKCGHWGSVRSAAPRWERMAAERRRALEAGQSGRRCLRRGAAGSVISSYSSGLWGFLH